MSNVGSYSSFFGIDRLFNIVIFALYQTQGVDIQVLVKGDNTRFPKRGGMSLGSLVFVRKISSGPSPFSDKISIHYVGKLMETGEIFDSSRERWVQVAIYEHISKLPGSTLEIPSGPKLVPEK